MALGATPDPEDWDCIYQLYLQTFHHTTCIACGHFEFVYGSNLLECWWGPQFHSRKDNGNISFRGLGLLNCRSTLLLRPKHIWSIFGAIQVTHRVREAWLTAQG